LAISDSVSSEGCVLLEHQRDMVAGFIFNVSASHLLVLLRSTNTIFSLFVRCSICHIIDNFCKNSDFTSDSKKIALSEQFRVSYRFSVLSIFEKMLLSFICSVILSFLLIFCLIYQIKTIFGQQRIEETEKFYLYHDSRTNTSGYYTQTGHFFYEK
jgi:hypothetical protein